MESLGAGYCKHLASLVERGLEVTSASPFYYGKSFLRPLPPGTFPKTSKSPSNLLFLCWVSVGVTEHTISPQAETWSPTALKFFLLSSPISLQSPIIWGLVFLEQIPRVRYSGFLFFPSPLHFSPFHLWVGMGEGLGA